VAENFLSRLRSLPALVKSSPRRRHLVAHGMRLAKPVVDLTAIAARRTIARRTRFVVIVGSFGKTTTTRALSLGLTGSISRFSQNNSGVWNSIAVLRNRPGARFSVVEVGISKPGEMASRARVLRPDVVVVTCIGSEHHRSFGTLEATRTEKARMVEALDGFGVAVLNGDDPNVMWMRSRTAARVVTFGIGSHNDVRASRIEIDWPRGTRFVLECAGTEHEVRTRLLGRETLRAILATAAVSLSQELPLEPILERLEALEPMRSRLQHVPLANGAHLIRDEMKSTLETIDAALDLFEEIPAERKICVLGEVSEPPGSQGPIYAQLGGRLATIATHAVLIGARESNRRYRAGLRKANATLEFIYQGKDVLEAVTKLKPVLGSGDVVLIKGRDTQRLARIALGLMGHQVRCGVQRCQIKLTDCDFCGRLETGWPGDPQQVP